MILIEGKKFACDTCIKGHRSSACKHTDRPLFEIQKKGRPITQCSHCRELRKTKQVHVKCQCGGKGGNEESQAGIVNSHKKAPEAVYPAGVSTTLQASIVLIPDTSSDSDQSSCNCKSGGQCHCAVPRKIKRTRQKNSTNVPISPTTLSRPHPDPTREYRHVLPKPPQTQNLRSHDGPMHVPSSTPPHVHVPRHHAHPDMLFSPYGRAYETSHSHDRPHEAHLGSIDLARREDITDANSIIVTNPDDQSFPWNIFNAAGSPPQSLCGCGDSCACIGCFEHRGSAAAVQALLEMSANNGCVNPNNCTSCVECAIIIGPSSETGPAEMQNLDEWLKQLTTPPLPSDKAQSLAYAVQQQMQTVTSNSLLQYGNPYTSSDERIHNQRNGASECCGGSCKCPPGLCVCGSDCCGRCQDCLCDGHQQEERGPLTFAVSGERVPCCNGQMEDGSSIDTQGIFLTLQPSIARPSSEASFESRRSRASSLSISDGVGERWDGMDFVPNPSSVSSFCSKERATLPATFYECPDDSNIL